MKKSTQINKLDDLCLVFNNINYSTSWVFHKYLSNLKNKK